ncbi:unnamed protein product [Paramecium sonneborni]|uniref:Uncharacterized protein n=1 Tax=Paramecium sonneborni TaxID=65129 RepID=A0A8S1QKM4_9CILI|nr:unnamed protein product [Paramecium sonneborni]
MKTIFIITIINILELGQVLGFTINDPECNKYLEKFGTKDNPSKIAFTGDVSYTQGTANAQINLRYSDKDLFNDPIFFGLVKEDGKTAETVCLELRLYKFSSKDFKNPVQVSDLPLTASNNTLEQWRQYSFTIPGNELRTRLIESNNTDYYIYNGYYAIAYYYAGTEELQYSFYFDFTLLVERKTGAVVETVFKPLSQRVTAGCLVGDCTITAETKLNWCTETQKPDDPQKPLMFQSQYLTCKNVDKPELHLNDQFIIQQIVNTTGLTNYYLSGTQVWYTGNGLNKQAKIISMNNTIQGQVLVQLKAEIAWRQVTIKIVSSLSNNQGRRILVQSQLDPVDGQTQVIECIKDDETNECPTCERECEINGFAHEGCEPCCNSPSCSFSQQIAFVFLALLLALII